jgi:hypothetical protein
MTLLVRDEEDILRENVEFHLAQGVDFIIATDNLSQDRTPDILEHYRRQGVLHVILETRDDYSQHTWVTRMARMAAVDFGADWVINNDADEFWHPNSPGDLKSCLARVPAEAQAVAADRHNFPVVSVDEPGNLPFFERLIWRDTASENMFGEPLQPKVCHRANREIVVKQGNHGVILAGTEIAAMPVDISILHFPARSYAQFENKIRLGGAAYARNTELNAAFGRAWRQLYKAYLGGRLNKIYRKQIPSPRKLAKLIGSGRLVEDCRLRNLLRLLHSKSGADRHGG